MARRSPDRQSNISWTPSELTTCWARRWSSHTSKTCHISPPFQRGADCWISSLEDGEEQPVLANDFDEDEDIYRMLTLDAGDGAPDFDEDEDEDEESEDFVEEGGKGLKSPRSPSHV